MEVGQRGHVPDCDDSDTIFEIKEIDVDGGIMLVVPVDGTSGSEAWIFEDQFEKLENETAAEEVSPPTIDETIALAPACPTAGEASNTSISGAVCSASTAANVDEVVVSDLASSAAGPLAPDTSDTSCVTNVLTDPTATKSLTAVSQLSANSTNCNKTATKQTAMKEVAADTRTQSKPSTANTKSIETTRAIATTIQNNNPPNSQPSTNDTKTKQTPTNEKGTKKPAKNATASQKEATTSASTSSSSQKTASISVSKSSGTTVSDATTNITKKKKRKKKKKSKANATKNSPESRAAKQSTTTARAPARSTSKPARVLAPGANIHRACDHCGRTEADLDSTPLLRCAGCKVTFYCCKAHQKADWKTHKAACMYLRSNPQSSLKHTNNAEEWASDMTGTFRWPQDHPFQRLPAKAFHTTLATACVLGSVGWKKYFQVRLAQLDLHVVHPSLVDGFSFALTMMFGLHLHKLIPRAAHQLTEATAQIGALPEPKPLTSPPVDLLVVLMGAAFKTEERILTDTDYLNEVCRHLHPYCRVHICLVGKELRGQGPGNIRGKYSQDHVPDEHARFATAQWFRGTVLDYLNNKNEKKFRAQFRTSADSDTDMRIVYMGLNTGLGSGNTDLMASWSKDLMRLCRNRCRTVFTCANDYGDLFGELRIMKQLLGARVVYGPQPNPWRCCTTFHAPGARDTDYCCGNSFLYAVHGYKSRSTVQTLSQKQIRAKVASISAAVHRNINDVQNRQSSISLSDLGE